MKRHAIWGYLSHNRICPTCAERLLLENDKELSQLYLVEEFVGNPRRPKERGAKYACRYTLSLTISRKLQFIYGD